MSSQAQQVERLARLIETLGQNLDALEEAGQGVPAVKKNAVRMRGALRQLEVQFCDLNAISVSPKP